MWEPKNADAGMWDTKIATKRFSVVRIRGYDPHEVDDFLDKVDAEMKALRKELERYKNATTELPRVDPLAANATSAAKLLEVAEAAAKKEVDDAKARAEEIRRQAEAMAAEIEESAHQEARRIVEAGTEEKHKEIGRLEEQRAALEQKVGALNDSHNKVRDILTATLQQATGVN